MTSREAAWPLTSMQLNMLFQSLHGEGAGAYVQQAVCRSETRIAESVVSSALAVLVDRHPALRTRFDWNEHGEPLQFVTESAEIPCETVDWTGDDSLGRFLRADRLRGFDFSCAPLLRVTFFRVAPAATLLVITNHHTILDGRSREIVMKELFQLVESGDPAHACLPASPPPFTDHLEWLAAKNFNESIPFWRDLLGGVSAATDLPLPRPFCADKAEATSTRKATLGVATTAALAAFARDCGCTLNNVVQAAWAILISRYCGVDDFIFGAVRACRHSTPGGEALGTVGMLINTVPVRCRLRPGAPVRELLRELNDQSQRVREYESTPASIVRDVTDLKAADRLYSTYVMFENTRVAGKRDESWTIEFFEQTELLNLSAIAGDDIALMLEYDPGRYSASAAGRLMSDLTNLLESLPENGDRAPGRIQFFSPSVVFGASGIPAAYSNVVEAVCAWAHRTGDAPAVLSESGNLTYAELDCRSTELACVLLDRGISPGSLIGLSIPRSPDLIVACLGIWKARCAYVPIDPLYPRSRREYMVSDSGVSLVLDRLPAETGRVRPRDFEIRSTDPAYVIYTSGSTGKPRGVLVSQGSVANLCSAVAREFELSPADRILQASTISFDISIEEIFPALCAGAAVVPRSDDAMSSTRDFLSFAERLQCTVLDLPTSFWHELTGAMAASGQSLPGSVRLLVVGGERVLPAVYRQWQSLPEARRVRWLNTYGPTETTVTATLFDPSREALPDPPDADLPIGRPLENVSAYVLDANLGVLPLEAAGELFIGGAGVAAGYLNAPELTAARFLPDPFRPGGRMYRTGDKARLTAGGNLEFLGRQDSQVKFRGFRLEPAEIEKAAESLPGVGQAVVRIRDGNTLALFVLPQSILPGGLTLEPGFIREKLEGVLPGWMVPDSITVLASLPLTINGKIDREALPEIPATADCAPQAEPETDLERKLTELWASLFQKSPIGPDENFFSLGGYSLLALRMLVQVEKLAGHPVTFADLNRAPTIRQMTKLLSGKQVAGVSDCLVTLRAGGVLTPIYCFHGAGGVVHWYNDLARLAGDRPILGIQSPELSPDLLPRTLEAMSELYLDAIRKFQPRGPYYFLGHSMGGMLAYHCAVLCASRGERVGFVGILDGWNRGADDPGPLAKMGRWLRFFCLLNAQEKAKFLSEKMAWLRSEQARRTAVQDTGGTGFPARDSIKAHNVRAALEYSPPPYRGVVHVFRAKRRSATEGLDPSLGWNAVASEVRAFETGGTHYSLLSPPNVEALAERICAILRQEDSEGKPSDLAGSVDYNP